MREFASRADRIEDARMLRLATVVAVAVHNPSKLSDLFFTPAWQQDTRSSEEIIASTLAAWGG